MRELGPAAWEAAHGLLGREVTGVGRDGHSPLQQRALEEAWLCQGAPGPCTGLELETGPLCELGRHKGPRCCTSPCPQCPGLGGDPVWPSSDHQRGSV